jgi:hypothetical protein
MPAKSGKEQLFAGQCQQKVVKSNFLPAHNTGEALKK